MTVAAAQNAWPTTEEVLAARSAIGFVSPLKPLEPGEGTCLFSQRGVHEFLVHPADAVDYLEHGIVVDGRRLDCDQVDEFPYMNGILLRCRDPETPKGFIP